jgi:hypothetical protein
MELAELRDAVGACIGMRRSVGPGALAGSAPGADSTASLGIGGTAVVAGQIRKIIGRGVILNIENHEKTPRKSVELFLSLWRSARYLGLWNYFLYLHSPMSLAYFLVQTRLLYFTQRFAWVHTLRNQLSDGFELAHTSPLAINNIGDSRRRRLVA